MSKRIFLIVSGLVIVGVFLTLVTSMLNRDTELVNPVVNTDIKNDVPNSIIATTTSTSSVVQIDLSEEELAQYEPLQFPNNRLDTIDWKTYVNEEHGFSFKYPSDWYIDSDEPGFLVVRPIERKDPNDDGGVFIALYKNEIKDVINDYIGRESVLKNRFYNRYTIYVFDYKLGVWDETYPYPDVRPTWQEYVVDLGTHRIGAYEPSNDVFRAEVLEQLVLSLSK
jgi:PsbP-like protein